jgi:hypothetical protein
MPDRTCLHHGCDLCGVRLRADGVPVSYLYRKLPCPFPLETFTDHEGPLQDPAYNSDGAFTPVVVAYAFLIGLQITNCFTVPLSSGVDTLFVAMAWDPEALMREHPELYQNMIRVYPHVQQAIHA